MKKKLISLLTAAAMVTGAFTALPRAGLGVMGGLTAEAASVITYNANDFAAFKNRTEQQVSEEYSKAIMAGTSYRDDIRTSYYSTQCSTKSPYHQGVLTDDTLAAMEAMTNFYRWLVGVDPLTVHCTQDESLQYQALDRNFYFDHYIPQSAKPDDMSDTLWQKGYSCTHNILALGSTPRGSVTAWLNEGYTLSSSRFGEYGHRDVLLSPSLTGIQYGYCGNISIGKSTTSSSSKTYTDTFSAFPAPGPMASEAIEYAPYTGWDAKWDTSAFKFKGGNISNVTVTIRNTSTGTEYIRTKTLGNLKGSNGAIQFAQAEDYDTSTGTYDSTYLITIDGLTDKNSKDCRIVYTVSFFKAGAQAASKVCEADLQYSVLNIHPDWNTAENLAKIAAGLPKTITVTTESGNTFSVPTKGVWSVDMTNKCFRNSADSSKLPKLAVDAYGLLDDVRISYVLNEEDCRWFLISSSPSDYRDIKEGTDIEFHIHAYIINFKSTTVCRINKDGSGEVVFDTFTTPDALSMNSNNMPMFTMNSAGVEDSGDYFSISYSPLYYWDEAYVSHGTVKLNVVHDYEVTVVSPTCTEGGCTVHTCKVCKYSYTDTPTAALGHDYEDTVIEPTAVSGGYTRHVCKRCKAAYRDSFTDPIKNTYDVTMICQDSKLAEKGFTVTFDDAEGSSAHSEDGKLVLPVLENGTYTMTVSADYFETVVCTVTVTDMALNSEPKIVLRLRGDANADGRVSADDAIIAARYSAGYGNYRDKYSKTSVDVNKDGFVTADDAIILARCSAGYGSYRERYLKG